MCQKGMGAFGSIIDLFAAEAASGMAWFLYLFLNCHNWNTFTLHFDSNFNQDQLHLHLTPAQERSQKGDSGCASEKLGVPHLLSD